VSRGFGGVGDSSRWDESESDSDEKDRCKRESTNDPPLHEEERGEIGASWATAMAGGGRDRKVCGSKSFQSTRA
jgi:hypothetical protein